MAETKRAPATSPLEWFTAVLGGLIALGLLGFIGWQALTGANAGPAILSVHAERIAPAQGGFVAEVTVRNQSDSTAAAVQIEGVLMQGDAVVESSRATIDYVPGRSRQKAGLLFTRDPAAHRLKVRATGYQEP